MNDEQAVYRPPLQPGVNTHLTLVALLGIASAASIWLVTSGGIGTQFILSLALAALVTLPIPVLLYRLYALLRGEYRLDRDTLRIQWGLRLEEIPISDVEWVRPVSAVPLPLPFLRLSGSILGVRRVKELGTVEFLASTTGTMLLVATARRIYAISPVDASGFVQDFQRAIELGSLSQAGAHSVYPSFVFIQAWKSPLTRFLWLSGLFVNLGLLAWVSALAPALSSVSVGFLPDKTPQPPSPGIQLMLLPLVSLTLFVIGWFAGLYYHRKDEQRSMAYILWSAGTLTSILILIAVLFILPTAV
ncbi:MAG: PH domain-containing protein [Chloroflexota bacterium]